MIRRAQEAARQTASEYDLCIVGSGPSGMTVAAELADTGLSICVIESGDESKSKFSDSMRSLEQTGLIIRDSSRERVLGGSSSTWRGLSALFDPGDYLPRPGFESYEGWPLPEDALRPYLARASRRYQFPPLELFEPKAFAPGADLPWEKLTAKVFLANRAAPNFGREFRALFARPHVDLVLGAAAVGLMRAPNGQAAASVSCKTPEGEAFEIRARAFVLAAGAIENARLLLSSDNGAGIGNEHDQVGRYLMDHPKGYRGYIRLAKDFPSLPAYAGMSHGPYSGYMGLRLSDKTQREMGALNAYVQIMPDFPWSERREIALAKSFARELRAWTRSGSGTGALTGQAWSVALALPRLAFMLVSRAAYGKVPKPRRLRMRFFLDMEPQAQNRVQLSLERDALGSPKARVHHALSQKDIMSWRMLVSTLRNELERLGLGTVDMGDADVQPPDEDASHHLGTTRMGKDPKTSVVNEDLRVHTASNVYAAGGSVCPTAGNANPTMLMVALSIKLADHLQDKLSAVRTPAPVGSDVLVVGAGRRVQADILSVLESLGLSARFFARTPRLLAGAARSYDVCPLSSISASDIAGARLLYLSVPPVQVAPILEALSQYDCSHLTVILPTPIGEEYRAAERAFGRIYAEEDSVYMPWVALAARAAGPPKSIVLHKSAYRYHAVALIRALVGGPTPGKITSAYRIFNTVHLRCGGVPVTLVEPRDYATGSLLIAGERATVCDRPQQGADAIELLGDAVCTAVRIGTESEPLSLQESALFGTLQEGDTVVTRMHDFKRVGLRRLVIAALQGGGWSAEEGSQDAKIDQAVRAFPYLYRPK
ncbi:MAG: GMC family oxidoreductase [Candidatus Pacebacteria bacterium]|nr:GMC family oxidoreductase [Candidatus Paceibacterota bacterium]